VPLSKRLGAGFLTIHSIKATAWKEFISPLQPAHYFSGLLNVVFRLMLNKRSILLIVGIVVAIAICLSTSLFGMGM